MTMSPSSRRAWIEIFQAQNDNAALASPSSRRAWIEITSYRTRRCPRRVALLAEGVDRNEDALHLAALIRRRPPRGGRG